jgi:hypothetical protein
MSTNMQIVVSAAVLALLWLGGWWISKREKKEIEAPQPDETPDAEEQEYLRVNAHTLVWAGFHDRGEIIEMLPDVASVEVAEPFIASIVDAEIASKRAAEKSWPPETDCDRLNAVLDALHEHGIFAQQYVGYTQSDGLSDISEALQDEDEGKYFGFCFYTAQDVEHLLEESRTLYLAFGANSTDGARAVEAGNAIRKVMRDAGFEVTWDESPDTRIGISPVDWKRRSTSGRRRSTQLSAR